MHKSQAQASFSLKHFPHLYNAAREERQVSNLTYEKQDLLSEHVYAQHHIVNGKRMHGGMDEQGRYVSPRSLGRPVAINAWRNALMQRGGAVFMLDGNLLSGPRMPNVDQWLLLLRHRFGQIFWNHLTSIAHIEGKGRLMAAWRFPDLQSVIKEDISSMAIGHLNKGLLLAHGLDEGGDPIQKIGGHDAMWLAARDLVFGEAPWQAPRAAAATRRPLSKELKCSNVLPKEHHDLLLYLLHIFLAEYRAETAFKVSEEVFMSGLFEGRSEQAVLATKIVQRISQDEVIHMDSLSLYLGEFRSITFKCLDGREVPGFEVIDQEWARLIRWTLNERSKQEFLERQDGIRQIVQAHPGGNALMEEFDLLTDAWDWNAQAQELA